MRMSQELKLVDIDKLIPYANNARTHSDEQIEQIQLSIREFGFVNPILVDRDFNIIAGHGRLLAAKAEGLSKIPCVPVEHLTEAQRKAYMIADNRLAEKAGWDMDILRVELEELREMDFNIELTGFSVDEFEEMDFSELQEAIEDNYEAEPPEKPSAKPGDLYKLGRHRLMCGDATILNDVEILMGGKKADMVFTDPPYNVDYEGGTEDKLKIQNDKMDDDSFYQFLYDSFVNMFIVTAAGGGIYICHADSEGINFRTAMRDAGWLQKQCLIWAKNSIVMGRQDYHWKHEPILYGWKPGAAHKWYGGRKTATVIDDFASVVVQEQEDGVLLTITEGLNALTIKVPSYEVARAGDDSDTSVWRIEKPLRNAEHPTMKPVSIPARAIRNSCKNNGIVLDLFGGSGSTLIAAEQFGRSCYTMELDPKYVDVIIDRWESFTGDKAVLLNV